MKIVVRCQGDLSSSDISYGEDHSRRECYIAFSGYLVRRFMQLLPSPQETFNMARQHHRDREFKELVLDLQDMGDSIPRNRMEKTIEAYRSLAQEHHLRFVVLMPKSDKRPRAA